MVTMKELSFEDFKRQMGIRLLYQRNLRGWTLDKVGEKIGLKGQSIHLHEIGQNSVKPGEMWKYAKIYDVSLAYLCGEDNKEDHFEQMDKKSLMIAKEISSLQEDIKLGFFHLAKQINKSIKKSENKEQAA
jgi:transcriptional regulator with XRE-family HTH domain